MQHQFVCPIAGCGVEILEGHVVELAQKAKAHAEFAEHGQLDDAAITAATRSYEPDASADHKARHAAPAA